MMKFPTKRLEVDVEALGGVIHLNEFTIMYRDKCNEDRDFDTPKNGLIDAGLTEEQVMKLGEQTAIDLYTAVVDFTYPKLREQIQTMIDDGTYVEPTEEEQEESKKN